MNYNETLKYINNTPKFSKILGNADLVKLLKVLGNPQDSLKFIHIAGTNGKGSTAAMTSSILRKAGYTVGLYTSPFIEVFNERIQVDGQNIPDSELAKIATLVKDKIDELKIEISVFAQITAMAFIYFKNKKCDYVVLETGLGGRLDATNVIKTPVACVLTKISYDHTEYLGDTIEKITAEKCGIIKENVPVITTSSQSPESLSVINDFCQKSSSPLITAKSSCEYELSLKGEFQKANAALAVEVCKLLNISEEDIKAGLLNTSWIARFEYLHSNLILDGAHNPDGVYALVNALKKLSKPVIFVVAMMEDKDYKESAKMIGEFSHHTIITELDMPRCIKADKLSLEFASCEIEKNCKNAVRKALLLAKNNEIVCVCGSLYLAGEVRAFINTLKDSQGS